MKINRVIIPRIFADKIQTKHHIELDEVHDVFENVPHFRRLEKGHIQGEDVYGAYGRTNAGRYLKYILCT